MTRHFIRNAFIRAVSLLGLTRLYRANLQREGPLLRVLVFHDVTDPVWFASLMSTLTEKYHVISPTDIANSRFNDEKINVLVTFDDGYASWTDVCLSILSRHGIKAIFFVNSGLVDGEGNTSAYVRENLRLTPRNTIGWEGVRRLAREGHTIGGHTVHHARLSLLPRDAQRDEVKSDKERIEHMIGASIVDFAYPFGNRSDYTEDTKEIIRGAGYMRAFTTAGTFADIRNVYALSRMCIEDHMSPRDFTEWIEGGYDLFRTMRRLCVR